MIQREELTRPWEGKIEPFRMFGNLYFVGMQAASSHLIDTGDGLILIDTGYLTGLYLVLHSIHQLGFHPKDIKYIINTHWHWDHAEASGALADLCGAKNIIGRYDAEDVRRYFEPDIIVRDGDVLALGNTKIHFMETPGHTRGTLSVFFDVTENNQTVRAGMFGGAGRNTLRPGQYEYGNCVADYFASVTRLKKETVGLFLGNHVWNNETEEKAEVLKATGENLFLDSNAWFAFLDECEQDLKNIVANNKNDN